MLKAADTAIKLGGVNDNFTGNSPEHYKLFFSSIDAMIYTLIKSGPTYHWELWGKSPLHPPIFIILVGALTSFLANRSIIGCL
jgi:hypothetical protein